MRLILIALFFFALFSTASAQQAHLPQWAQELDSLFAARYNRVPDSIANGVFREASSFRQQFFEQHYPLPSTAICRYSADFVSTPLDSIDLNNLGLCAFEVPGYNPETLGVKEWHNTEILEVFDSEVVLFLRPGFILAVHMYRESLAFLNPAFGLRALLDRHFPLRRTEALSHTTPNDTASQPRVSPLKPSRAMRIYRKQLPYFTVEGLYPSFTADSLSHPLGYRMARMVAPMYFSTATSVAFVPAAIDSAAGPIVMYYLLVQYKPFEPEHGYAYISRGHIVLLDKTEWAYAVSASPADGYAIIELERVVPKAFRLHANEIGIFGYNPLNRALHKAFNRVKDPHRH